MINYLVKSFLNLINRNTFFKTNKFENNNNFDFKFFKFYLRMGALPFVVNSISLLDPHLISKLWTLLLLLLLYFRNFCYSRGPHSKCFCIYHLDHSCHLQQMVMLPSEVHMSKYPLPNYLSYYREESFISFLEPDNQVFHRMSLSFDLSNVCSIRNHRVWYAKCQNWWRGCFLAWCLCVWRFFLEGTKELTLVAKWFFSQHLRWNRSRFI